MEETRKRRWLIILFFTVLTVLFVSFIYFGFKGPIDPRYRRRLEEAVQQYRKQADAKKDTINVVLSKGKTRQIGNIVLGYRGIENDTLLIDVIILELDPEMTYPHKIPSSKKKQEIRLGGQPFKIISAGKSSVHLRRIIK